MRSVRRCASNFCQNLGEASELIMNAQRVASALDIYSAHTERTSTIKFKKSTWLSVFCPSFFRWVVVSVVVVRSRSLVRWMALQCANRTASSSGQQASEAHCSRLGSLLYVRCRHRSAKSTAVSSKTFLFQVTHIYLFCGSATLST